MRELCAPARWHDCCGPLPPMVDISVVIPTRDRTAMLTTALRSALAQDGVTFEIIVVDDGSQHAIVPQSRDLNGRLVLWRHPEPRGVSAARNTGITLARDSGSPSSTTTTYGPRRSSPGSWQLPREATGTGPTPATSTSMPTSD